MSDVQNYDLGLKDIRFLKAIRDINESPDEYPATDDGKMPATKTAVRRVSSLSDDAVRYRFEQSADVTTDGDYGLVEILSAKIKDNGGFGPKSARLTEKGSEVLDRELENRDLVSTGVHPSGGDGSSGELEAAVAKLEERLTSVEAKLDRVMELVEEWEESSTGALNDDEQRAFEALMNALPAHNNALKALGISPSQVGEAGDIDSAEVRANVRESLREEGGQPAAAESEGGVPGDQSDFDSLQSDS